MSIERRTFLKSAGVTALTAGLGPAAARGFVPAHNWEKHDFGSGPAVRDRLYQGPFPQYPPEEVLPGGSMVMATTPFREVIPNFGMGLTVYISGDYWPPRTRGDSIEKYCEDLIRLPFAQKVCIRLNWRDIGYRVRPSWIWSFQRDGFPGLVLGLVNDGIACVPRVLRVSVLSENGQTMASGCLDPGYPLTRGVRQVMFMLPKGTDWQGLHLKAELEVKGERYPVTWACRQKLNDDGTLTLRPSKAV